ncbi:zinc finger protein 99-like [Armigeres subalbatus]|uniref:zinc finger protein 99-like n=1 Tax=Armigeres subalbatus TaxID=124917 RepID=UPI002ED4C0C8
MDNSSCFMCGQNAEEFHITSGTEVNYNQNIYHIICQHFWFDEAELQAALICKICWLKVDQFHCFYQHVKHHRESLLEAISNSIFIKQEEVEIDEELLKEPNHIDLAPKVEDLQDRLHCETDTIVNIDERNQLQPKSNSPIHKAKKKPKVKRNPKSITHLNVTPEQQAEDEFIKQHRPYVCEECNEEFNSYCAIRRHTIDAHDKRYIMCCEHQYRTRSMLYQHVQNIFNPEAIKCEICSRTFKFQSGYIRHKEEIHPEQHQLIFKCRYCSKSFPKQKLLKRHLAEHETLEKQKAKCDICGKCFRTQVILKNHIRAVHQVSRDFICEICSRGFFRRAMLMMHRKLHDLTDEQMKKQCPVCNKWLKNHRYWLTHVRRHKDEGDYKCEQCGHVSINLMALKAHIRYKHAPDKKRHVCELCGKEYSRATTLKEHVANAHTGEPLYKCQFCERKFFSNATMHSHRKKDHPQEWLQDKMAKYARKEDTGEGDSVTE